MIKAWTLAGDALVRKHLLRHSDRQVGDHLAAVMPRLGPLYVKAGQMMASRPDVVAREMREALVPLESNVVVPDIVSVRDAVARAVAVYPEAEQWLDRERLQDEAVAWDALLAAG